MIRILIVDHDAALRDHLLGALAGSEDCVVIGIAASAADGFSRAAAQHPDAALIGTTLADGPGLNGATEFRRRFPSIAVIVVAAQESDDELFDAICAGAAAYVGREVNPAMLISLITQVAAGERPITELLLDKPYVAARLLEQFRSTVPSDLAPHTAFAPLTDRELELLRKVSDGMTNAEIGYALGISARTVKSHIDMILRKLAVTDRTQAVVTALKRGWLGNWPDDPPAAGMPVRPPGPRPAPGGRGARPTDDAGEPLD
jgi:DNA-binding NarL/FixJ family response regulator